jgi:hypothetical protein
MEIINLTSILKERFQGIAVNMQFGTAIWPVTDGMVAANHRFIFVFQNVECRVIDVIYGDTKPSTLPSEITKKVWLLANCRESADEKNYTVKFQYAESTVINKSVTVTEGSSVTMKADASFEIGIAKASAGVTEVTTLNLQKVDSNSITKNNSITEDIELSYNVPAKMAIEVTLTKELKRYETSFVGKFLIDGDIFVTATNLSTGPTGKYAAAGRISQYLPDTSRIIDTPGFIDNIKGEVTKRITSDFSVADRPDLCNPEFDNSIHHFFTVEGSFNKEINPIALITIDSISSLDNGYFDIVFDIETPDCYSSACAGFQATLVIEDNGDTTTQIRNFAGWSAGESMSNSFTISRSEGISSGTLIDVVDISEPEIVCND